MRRRALSRPAGPRINVTPMIDVVMVLIVFYLMVGQMARDQQADLPLPPSRAGVKESIEGALIVEVRRGAGGVESIERARMSLGGTPVTAEVLESVLRAELSAHPDRPVRIRADRALSYGAVEPAIEAARRAGATVVRLAAERVGP